MLFLINNPAILFVVLIIVGFLIFMGVKIYNEVMLNRQLKVKQTAMRVTTPEQNITKRIGLLASTALAPVLVVALVFSISFNQPISPGGELATIRDGNDIVQLYNEFEERMSSFQVFSGWGFPMAEDDLDFSPEADDVTNDFTGSGSDDYSRTNNQVSGVDEMDNVITDGLFIYTIENNRVFVTLAYTVEDGVDALDNHLIIQFDESDNCTNFYVTGMYVDDDYLVVLGSHYDYYCAEEDVMDEEYSWYYWGQSQYTEVYVYDKNDDFNLISEYEVSGDLIGTRKIDDNLIIVTSKYLYLNNDDIEVDQYLPEYSVNGNDVQAEYQDIAYIEGTSPNAFTSFFMIDLDNEVIDMEVILGDRGHNLYVSSNNIYLVGNIYYFVPMAEFIDVEEPVAETKTLIQKISIDDADLEYANTGIVKGYTLNQFSMDEFNGNLRIATTTGFWGSSINNRVFILNENLEELSVIENLGKPGETIKSVRFSGDYGYVVTFEQTDPFYVINLSNPQAPFTEGELEIPGFSTYLQPLGNDYMLGIGFGDNSGGTNGLKISIYDISDKSNPVVFDEVIFDYSEFGWAWSSATYNHKDLLVDLNKGIVALPFSTYNYSGNTYTYNSGILVYNFDEVEGLEYSGFITHELDSTEDVYVYKIKFIDQYFYSISNKYIKASLITDPENIIKEVLLPN